LTDQPQPVRFLIHEHDTKFSATFDYIVQFWSGKETTLPPFPPGVGVALHDSVVDM
jgi:hypothetical protein